MNPREVYEQCRENPNYTLYNAVYNDEFRSTFNNLVYCNEDRREIIEKRHLRIYEINTNQEAFEELKKQKSSEYGVENVQVREFYHGPSFQNESNLCEFNVPSKRCSGHNGQLVLTSQEPFYINMNGINANPNNRNFGYLLWGKVLVHREHERDPEDNSDLSQHFNNNFDLINDYGNNKFLKCSEDFFPTHIIFYNRNRNPRLDDPNHQPYQIELMTPLPPPPIYENVPLEEEFLAEVFQCPEYNRDIQVISVQKIVNPILEEQFNLVKENLGPADEIETKRVFHGLPFERADAVARFNLDWRKGQYGKYGWGLHFGQHPHNAKYFPHRYPSGPTKKRCMIAFDVLMKNSIDQSFEEINNINLPPQNPLVEIDTVEVPRTGDIIKFNDHEFLPRFKIIYYDHWGG